MPSARTAAGIAATSWTWSRKPRGCRSARIDKLQRGSPRMYIRGLPQFRSLLSGSLPAGLILEPLGHRQVLLDGRQCVLREPAKLIVLQLFRGPCEQVHAFGVAVHHVTDEFPVEIPIGLAAEV